MNETLEPRVLITKESAQGIVPGSPVNLNQHSAALLGAGHQPGYLK
jgi:hypothetical protein